MSHGQQAGGYVVPSYQAPDDTSWFHFLHGNVPGHQIDFMYRPDVPQGALSRQHFSHLSRLMKYIEPQTNGAYAFAIGNLSRDDTQYEPGRGGVALMFGLRIRGVTDHAGRQDPPFAHAIAAIDREIDYTTLLRASISFHRHVLGAAESAEWYRTYVRCAEFSPADMGHVLANYVATFNDLPRAPASTMGLKWITGGAPQPKRIVIVHADGTPFEQIADCASRITAMLYRSDIRWTSISNGREADVPNGVSIRFFAENSLGPNDAPDGARHLDDVPEGEAEIAQQLFGAKTAEKKVERVLDWRERYAGNAASAAAPEPAPAARAPGDGQRPSWEGREYRPPAVRLRPQPPDDDATQVWEGRPEPSPQGATGEEDIQVDLSGDEAPPSVNARPSASMGNGAANAQPTRASAPSFNGAGVQPSVADPRPPTLENRPSPAMPRPVTPVPVMPRPATPVPVAPASMKTTLVMPAPAQPATDAPVVPRPPTKSSSTEWEPSPNFRSPNFRSPRAPMLRWTLIIMAIAGVILAVLYFAFSGNSSPTPGDPGASSAEPSTNVAPPKTEPTTPPAATAAGSPTSKLPPASASSAASPPGVPTNNVGKSPRGGTKSPIGDKLDLRKPDKK